MHFYAKHSFSCVVNMNMTCLIIVNTRPVKHSSWTSSKLGPRNMAEHTPQRKTNASGSSCSRTTTSQWTPKKMTFLLKILSCLTMPVILVAFCLRTLMKTDSQTFIQGAQIYSLMQCTCHATQKTCIRLMFIFIVREIYALNDILGSQLYLFTILHIFVTIEYWCS